MSFSIIVLPVVLLFVANGFGYFIYAIKLKKNFPEEHNIINSIIISILWIGAGLLYPFIYSTDNSIIQWFQVLSTFFICIFTQGIIFFIFYYHFRLIKKSPELKNKRDFNVFLKNYDQMIIDEQESKFKTDIYRKALHLFPAAVIILLWVFSVYIWSQIWNVDRIWGIDGENFGRFLIITAGFSGILVFAALDYVRLSYIFENHCIFHLLPNNVSNLLEKSLKRNELFEFTRPVAMVLAFVPIFFFPFGIFAAAALIATIGDGAASLAGLKFGKHHFPKKSDKTIIGYIAGFLGSFGISLFALWIFESNLSMIKLLIIALGGALTFFVIDFLNLKIDDDILNPLCCAIIMILLYWYL